MAWPTPQDYNEAVQNPRYSFTDPELQAGQPELNRIGLPRPIAGGFACVYKIKSGSNSWAARCFLSEVADQQQRYEAISKHLSAANLPHTVPFTYLPSGIKIHGRAYPLVKMQWVQGESLSAFVARSVAYRDTLISLGKAWSRLLADLKAANIAHGDLQHGNIVVVGDQLRLLDYDGMFVPTLAGKQSNEVGHRNYQLPSRTRGDYGAHLDNFSAWVIYVSLLVLAVHPELWAKHGGGDECLIFRQEDFKHPKSSLILRDLALSPNAELRFLVEIFVSYFHLSPQDVPALDENFPNINDTTSIRSLQTNWWADHEERAPQAAEARARTAILGQQPAAVDPGWIVDSVQDDRGAEPTLFRGRVKDIRTIMAGSLAFVAFMNFQATIPAAQVALSTTCLLGLNCLLCYVRFKRDPCHADFHAFRTESAAFVRRLQEHQVLIDSISAERITLQNKLAAAENEISKQRNQLMARYQAGQNAAEAEFDLQLRSVNERLQKASSSETNSLNSIKWTFRTQIAELDRRIAGLNLQEHEEKAGTLNAMQEDHMRRFLRSHLVENNWIPGVSATFKTRVVDYGFRTAADIEDCEVRSVPGIGQVRGSALVQWRQGLERQARKSAPKLSSQQSQTIESKYRQQRLSLEASKQQLQLELNTQDTKTREYFAGVCRSLKEEEQHLRSALAQRKGQLQQDQNVEVAKLEQRLMASRNQGAPRLAELSQKLSQAQKQLFALRWQAAKREKEGRRFASLSFSHYLRKVTRESI